MLLALVVPVLGAHADPIAVLDEQRHADDQAAGDLGRRELEIQEIWWLEDKEALNSRLTAFAETYQLTGLEIITAQGEKIAASRLVAREGKPRAPLPSLKTKQLEQG